MKPPEGWKEIELGKIGSFYSGLSGKTATDFGQGSPFVPYNTVYQCPVCSADNLPKVIVGDDETQNLVKYGDALFTVSSETPEEVGMSSVFLDRAPVYLNSFCLGFRYDQSELIPLYASFLFRSAKFRRLLWPLAQGSTRYNISRSELVTLRLVVPPPPEQAKIAAILTSWSTVLEKLDLAISAKSSHKKALMQQLLSGKRRLKSFQKETWKPLKMADALERVFRPAEQTKNATLDLVSIRRRCGGLFRRPEILASEYRTQDLHVLKRGDFLVSKRQVVHGAWAIIEPDFDGTLVSKEYAIFVNRAPEVLDMRFFAWLSQTPRMLRLARVASTGVHIEKLIFDPDVFLREKISVPKSVKEQAAIAAILDAAENELRILRQQRDAIERQKRGLMQQLLTGKRRVST